MHDQCIKKKLNRTNINTAGDSKYVGLNMEFLQNGLVKEVKERPQSLEHNNIMQAQQSIKWLEN